MPLFVPEGPALLVGLLCGLGCFYDAAGDGVWIEAIDTPRQSDRGRRGVLNLQGKGSRRAWAGERGGDGAR